MKALLVEFQKTRKRKIWVIIVALIAVELLWLLWAFRKMDGTELAQGWKRFMYQLPLLNALIMPVVAAVTASRICDIEHKGNTLKLLCTFQPAGKLFDAKFIYGALFMIAAILLQVAVMLGYGTVKGFTEPFPSMMLAYYLLFVISVSLTLYLLQQVLSLLFTNQMAALTIGLLGGLFGLFSMFFPQWLQKIVPWGYYGVLMVVNMSWDEATRLSTFQWLPANWSGFFILLIMFCILYSIGRNAFVRKEL
jgi:hypothetical protein